MFWQSKLRHFHSIPMNRKLVKEFPLLALALALVGMASPCAAQLVRPQPHPPGVPVPEIQEQAQVPVNAAPGSLPTFEFRSGFWTKSPSLSLRTSFA